MSVLRYFIIIGILTVGVYVFSCTSPTEAPSPEFTEINSHTDSLLQFRIYLAQARISRFKGENQEEAHFQDAAKTSRTSGTTIRIRKLMAGESHALPVASTGKSQRILPKSTCLYAFRHSDLHRTK